MIATVETLKPDFRVFKVETTRFWREDIQKRAGKLFAVYIFDINRHVHCCELMPSYEMHYVGPTWEGQTTQDDELFNDILMGDVDTDPIAYHQVRNVDVSKLECCPMTDEAWDKLLDHHDGDSEVAYQEAIEKEIECLRCNGWIY